MFHKRSITVRIESFQMHLWSGCPTAGKVCSVLGSDLVDLAAKAPYLGKISAIEPSIDGLLMSSFGDDVAQ